MLNIKNALAQSRDIISSVIKNGDIVIDATMGNGNDTELLANLVGESGRVYAFDVQKNAIETTKKKLQKNGLINQVDLILDSHKNIDKYVDKKVNGVMFNLGYLPRQQHIVSTEGKTTVEAIKKSLDLLCKNGIITIVVYHGGDTGFVEKNMVLTYLETIPQKMYTVTKMEFINQINNPPILICIEKKTI